MGFFSGKTSWILRFIRNLEHVCANPLPKRIVYCYAHEIARPKEIPHSSVIYQQGLPNFDILRPHDLLVLDDGQTYINDPRAVELFTVLSHHVPVSVTFA